MLEERNIVSAEGIYKNGFGTVSKLILGDKSLSIGAKGLYCYICSYAGSGNTAFPYRSRICEELNISEKTYQKYTKELIDKEYIDKKQIKNGTQFGYNLITIKNTINIKEIKRIVKENKILFKNNFDENYPYDEYEDIDICGYGKIPKTITKDEGVSLKAKALFGFISSNSKKGNKSISSKEVMETFSISENTYYKLLNELIDKEYIIKKEYKTKKSYLKKILIINVKKENNDGYNLFD